MPGEIDADELIGGAADQDLRELGIAVLEVMAGLRDAGPVTSGLRGRNGWGSRERLNEVLAPIQRRKLAWTGDDAMRALLAATAGEPSWQDRARIRLALRVAEVAGANGELEAFRAALTDLREVLIAATRLTSGDRAALVQRAAAILGGDGDDGDDWQRMLTDRDGWSRAVQGQLAAGAVPGLGALLQHLASGKTKPSERWFQQTAAMVADPKRAGVVRTLVEELRRHERETTEVRLGDQRYLSVADLLDAPNAEVARGALWAAAVVGDRWAVPALRDAAVHCATFPGGGATARSEKLANTCMHALARVGGDDAVAALAWLQNQVKNRSVRKQIDIALADVAQATGLSPSQLLERSVPNFGLDGAGRREQQLGSHAAVLDLHDDAVVLTFRNAEGRTLRSIPAAVKQDHASDLAELKAVVKDAKKAISAERARLEALLATEREWEWAEWHRLYLDHPVTASFARRLIWEVDAGGGWKAVIPTDAAAVDATGAGVDVTAGSVRMWHPSRADAATIAAWRSLLVDREIRQPFKQAFREIYRLTPAEAETETYSNRFAAHVLGYPQANALIRTRGWNARGLGYWDGGFNGEAVRTFPDAAIRSVFYYDLIEQDSDGYGTPALCSTDQVRFERLENRVWQRCRLDEVPPLVFSEAMRDVDLFVGVTSIAADPQWTDRGVDRRFDDYWTAHSFGELEESAITRRAALERLIPKTKIAERCTVADRYLIVRGQIRTYKIHIGSGNILMEPDDSYLCIVPARRADIADKLFLPFEEDGGRLSLIISKAFLLAADDAITDETILRQLRLR